MDIQQSLRDYIASNSEDGLPDGFDDDFDLINSGLIDSMFMMSLVTFLEKEHGVEFGMNDLVPKNFKSVAALAEFARTHRTANA